MTIVEGSGAIGHQSEKRDQLDFLEPTRDRQYELTTWYERKTND